VAAVNIVYLNKLLTLKEAERRFLPALQRAAKRIEDQLSGRPETLTGPWPGA
jgi:DNA-binding IclR family transcriptional regulator